MTGCRSDNSAVFFSTVTSAQVLVGGSSSHAIHNDAQILREAPQEWILDDVLLADQRGGFERSRAAVEAPMQIGSEQITVGASVGWACRAVGEAFDDVYRRADRARYDNKLVRKGLV